ncbi:MAG: ADP-heptose--LPS heptosyltransferase RfaF, partial [Bacteroidota bacterium]
MDKKDKPVHILVIRLSALGDVAMMVPVLQALHLKYPDIRTTILTKKAFVPIFAEVEKVEVVVAKVKREHKGFQGLWRLYRELKKREIDAVADLHNVLRSKIL